jgi:hypothetical protein
MKNKVRFLGLDVHAETIAVAIAEPDAASGILVQPFEKRILEEQTQVRSIGLRFWCQFGVTLVSICAGRVGFNGRTG